MTRNLKAFGLALVAVFAMGALSASSASAVDRFTVEGGGNALLTGVGTHQVEGAGHISDIFNITHGNVNFRCTTAKFAGTAANNSTEATVDAEYTGKLTATPHGTTCNSSLGDITVDMNGCHYVLTGNTTGHDPTPNTDATVWITCPGTNKIAITGPGGATITVPAQTPTTGGVTYTNLPNHGPNGKAAVTVTSTVTGITYSCHPTFTCTLGGVTHHNNDADYNGHVIVTGYADTEGLPTPVTEGANIGVSFHSA